MGGAEQEQPVAAAGTKAFDLAATGGVAFFAILGVLNERPCRYTPRRDGCLVMISSSRWRPDNKVQASSGGLQGMCV